MPEAAPNTYGFLIHKPLNTKAITRAYKLEFVDKEFYLDWIVSPIVRPVGGQYKPEGSTPSETGSGYIYDEVQFPTKPTETNVVVFYTDDEDQNYVAKLRIDEPHKVQMWLAELSKQPKDTGGPGRPPKRWLEMTDYRARVRVSPWL